PDDEILPIVKKYWSYNRPDAEIVARVLEAIDQGKFGFSVASLKRFRKKHGLFSTRQQKHTPDTIRPFVLEIRERLPTIGAGDMVVALFEDYNMKVSNHVVRQYFDIYEPDAKRARRQNRLKRKRFWAAGVNDIWSFDQHDKWKRFGLLVHLGAEVVSGKLLWLRVWWSNRQTPLLASYYLRAAREHGAVCLVTQSDPGGENYGIARPHTAIRQHLDPSLVGTIQHRWMREKMNIVSEIKWGVFRRQFSPGFEGVLEEGVTMGWYMPGDNLHKLTFRWLVIPWMQLQMDNYVRKVNRKLPRRNKKKFLPHGIPDLIFERSVDYGMQDFKVPVNPELLDAIEQEYAPPNHPVFQLAPPWFNAHILAIYTDIQEPEVTVNTLWVIFQSLLVGLRARLTPQEMGAVYGEAFEDDENLDLNGADPRMHGEPVPWPADEYEGIARTLCPHRLRVSHL
ncbi:hypothetical protein EXIGLDRAFT_613613, partial [Exidia glandulosa HHB12029]